MQLSSTGSNSSSSLRGLVEITPATAKKNRSGGVNTFLRARARCDKGGGFMLTQGGCRCAFGVQRCQVQGENIEQTLVVRGAGRAGHQIGNGMSPVISSPPRCVIRRRRRRRRRRRGRYEIIVLQIVFIVGVAEVGQVLVQVAQFKIFIHLPFLRVAHQHRHTFQRGRPVVDSCAATKEKTLRWKKEKKSSRKKTGIPEREIPLENAGKKRNSQESWQERFFGSKK